jgi:hypothetical protein
MMTSIVLLVVGIWAVINTVERALILAALRRQDARWQAQAEVVAAQAKMVARVAETNSLIADNAKQGAHFMAEHRARIERLERLTSVTHGGPN